MDVKYPNPSNLIGPPPGSQQYYQQYPAVPVEYATHPNSTVMRTTGMDAAQLPKADLNEGVGPDKRTRRLAKNREAARECRRKKKEYVKCLEDRVQLLEQQNLTLIQEIKKLKGMVAQGQGGPLA